MDSNQRTPEEIHFFDLDHTLIHSNSSVEFAYYLKREGLIPFVSLLILYTYYFLFQVGLMSVCTLHRKVCNRFLKGKSLSEIESLAEQFVRENFRALLYTPAVELLQAADRAGHHIVLLSSSPDYLVRVFAGYFEVDEWAATTYGSQDDRIHSVEKLMEGKDKAAYLEQLSQELEVPRERIFAYSDSSLDLFFLKASGHPIAVNPDRSLRRICSQNHWLII